MFRFSLFSRTKQQRRNQLKLIVGLGNPGHSYSSDRHNVGFMCVNFFAKTHGIRFDKTKGYARIGEGEVTGIEVTVARPQTYMNASGKAVNALLRKLKTGPDDLIVIHDDMDLPLGRIRIRKGGSSAGHKGVQSIIGDIGTADFIRIRIGIGRPLKNGGREEREQGVIDYVLSDFSREERNILDKVIPRVNEALECLLSSGLTEAMNSYNTSSS